MGTAKESGTPEVQVDSHESQGVQIGPGIQINVYRETPLTRWPCQVGAVPMLADCFQDRVREGGQLAEAMAEGQTIVITQVLSGLGGIGKTQLAASYARQAWAEGNLDLLVWVTASTRGAVQVSYAHAGAQIGHVPVVDVERGAEWFLGWLQTTRRRWLIVLDDLADPADLQCLWPEGPGGQVLVTTRRRDASLAAHGQRIEVGLFSPDQAMSYLRAKIPHELALDQASELAADLGYLPLALAQAAAFIRDRQDTCAGYRRRLHDRRKRLIELLPPDALADDYRSTVAATWSISVEAADRLVPVGLARPLMHLASTLDPNGAPVDVFTTPAALAFFTNPHPLAPAHNADPLLTEQDCRDALSNLHRLSLVSLDHSSGYRAVRTHALVQRATLEQLPLSTLTSTVQAAADALVHRWPDLERDIDLSQVLRNSALTLIDRHEPLLWTPDAHPVLFRVGQSLGECGLVAAAVRYWKQIADDTAHILGPDHHNTLTIRACLARWRGQSGDPAGAAKAFEQLLTDQLRVLGPRHLNTLTTRAGLARWRGQSGDPAGAAKAFEDLLADRLRMLGPNHPDTLTTRANLAHWRGKSGDSAGAATATEQLLTDQLRVLGPDHPDTLTTRANLAHWRGKSGDPAGAATAFQQLLADRLRVLGPDRPDTLNTRDNLARWRGNAGDLAGAVADFDQLITEFLRVLGPDHPDTLAARASLAHWRGKAGDSAGAAEAFEQLLTDQLRVLGPDHPHTLINRANLARWRGKAGDSAGAAEAFEQLLTDQLRVLGPDHPDTLTTRHNVAHWRGKAGDPEGAVTALEQLLTERMRVLGPDHPDTLTTRASVARWCRSAKKERLRRKRRRRRPPD